MRQNNSNLSQLESIKKKQMSLNQVSKYDSNPSNKQSSGKEVQLRPSPFTNQTPLNKQPTNQTPIQKKGDLDPASQTKNMNIMDDYEFT